MKRAIVSMVSISLILMLFGVVGCGREYGPIEVYPDPNKEPKEETVEDNIPSDTPLKEEPEEESEEPEEPQAQQPPAPTDTPSWHVIYTYTVDKNTPNDFPYESGLFSIYGNSTDDKLRYTLTVNRTHPNPVGIFDGISLSCVDPSQESDPTRITQTPTIMEGRGKSYTSTNFLLDGNDRIEREYYGEYYVRLFVDGISFVHSDIDNEDHYGTATIVIEQYY